MNVQHHERSYTITLDKFHFSVYNRTKKEGVKMSLCCEQCAYYNYDEEYDAYVCLVSLDEDDMCDFLSHNTGHCPYYRFYDEYKSVQKQI